MAAEALGEILLRQLQATGLLAPQAGHAHLRRGMPQAPPSPSAPTPARGDEPIADRRRGVFRACRHGCAGGEEPEPAMRVYTGYVRFPHGDVEEIDVFARGPREARRQIVARLGADYEPGGHINRVVERFGWYL